MDWGLLRPRVEMGKVISGVIPFCSRKLADSLSYIGSASEKVSGSSQKKMKSLRS